MSFEQALVSAARESGVTLARDIIAACAAHYAALVRWNKTHNLTRVVEPDAAARLHYLDCLMPLLALPAPTRFVDVGSGAGFPGLLAQLAWPGAHGLLVEPAQKRASFLQLAAGAMGRPADQVVVVGSADAVEPFAGMVLSRATFSPGKRRELARYCALGAEVVVWGHHHDISTWDSEVRTWGFEPLAAIPYRVDGLEERCVLRARPVGR